MCNVPYLCVCVFVCVCMCLYVIEFFTSLPHLSDYVSTFYVGVHVMKSRNLIGQSNVPAVWGPARLISRTVRGVN